MIEKNHITQVFRFILPILLTIIAVVGTVIQFPVPILGIVRPDFLLVFIYFWVIYRPKAFSVPFIFLSSLFIDILISPFIGLGPIVYISLSLLVKSQRRFLMGQSFLVQWLCFALLVLIKIMCEWGVMALFSATVFPLFHSLILLTFTTILYPFLAILLLKVNRKMV